MSDLNNNIENNNNNNNIPLIKSLKFPNCETKTSLEQLSLQLQEIHDNMLNDNDKINTNFPEIVTNNNNKQIINNNIETENKYINTEKKVKFPLEKKFSENLTEREFSYIVRINTIRKIGQHRNDLENFRYQNLDDLSESIIPLDQISNIKNSKQINPETETSLNTVINAIKDDHNEEFNFSEVNSNINEAQNCKSLVKMVNDSENINPLQSDSFSKNEEINLRLTNLPSSDGKRNISKDISEITNELNKACIKTIDNFKSKDNISNLENDSPRKLDTEIKGEKDINLLQEGKMSLEKKKNNLEILFQQEPEKDENEVIEETKKEIYNEIDNVYKIQLNLVKINNKEQYTFISKYNDVEKDQNGYESNYFLADKNDINYLNRRNSFLNEKYFSYIFNKQNNSEEDENNYKDQEVNFEDIKINIFDVDKIKKFKKNYDEEIKPIVLDLKYIRENLQHENIKEYKIHDIENMSSFFYNFHFYSPEEGFKKIIDEKSENQIIDSFTTYRKVLNDGKSFKRCFSYLLLETFILQNKIKQLDFLIYDIKKSLKKKFPDIQKICNVLIDIKENSSIDYLMNSYNNPKLNFDEVMITYIEETVNNALEIKENKYQEIDLNFMNTVINIFGVDLEIYYIEKEENKDGDKKFLTMNNYEMYCQESLKCNHKLENNSHEFKIPTFRLLFFLNSFYIVYTKKCDIDSTLANNNIERQYYYVPSLPKYKCSKCNKQTPLDIIPQYEALFCHICLEKYLKEILEKRIKIYVESNFSCIEYYTKPININSNIQINFSLYKYITGNYITDDFRHLLDSFCFKCLKFITNKKSNKPHEIKKLDCHCQFCTSCIEEIIKENTKGKSYLNKYELKTIKRTKCLCGKDIDLETLFKFSKIKPEDIKKAEERLIEKINERCCLCEENDPLKIFKFAIVDGPFHFMCIKCHEEELKKHDRIEKNEDDSNFISKNSKVNNNNTSKDLTSSDSRIKNNFNDEQNKKFSCKICFDDHIWSPNNMKDVIGKVPCSKKQSKTCCGKKCQIF